MPTDLSPEEMKRLVVEHFEDFVNRRRPEVIQRNMTDDFHDHDGPGGRPTDREGDEMRAMYEQLPGVTVEVLDVLADGDKVVCRNIWRWTSAAGKAMQFHGFVMWRVQGNRIAERWATVTAPAEGTSWSMYEDAPTGGNGRS